MNQRLFWQRVKISTLAILISSWSVDLAVAQQAKNQFGSSFRNRPTVSPYLSTLDNGGGQGALNYFNIVKPQQRARTTARQFENELHTVEAGLQTPQGTSTTPTNSASITPITTGRLPPTGHTATFGDTAGRFGSGSGGSNNDFGRNGKKR